MAVEYTLSVVKPDGVAAGLVGEVISRYEKAKLRIVALRMIRLTPERARGFYAVHKERPFFASLIKFMTSGSVVLIVLRGENAVARVREIMGATDPAKAEAGTIRADYGTSIESNIVHGADGPETARFEVDYFFKPEELIR
ncbi:MAG: nucleoside-diphosphate kinase [Vicinamibacteria bacterium]